MVDLGPDLVGFELDHPQLAFSRFIEAADDFLGLLREVATDIVGPGGVRWVVEDVSRSSPVRLSVRPIASRKGVRTQDLAEVNRSITNGFATIQSRPERPAHFNDRALEKAKDLARKVGTDLSLLRVNGRSDQTDVTGQLIANVDAILGETVSSIGTIDGSLEALNVHGDRYFSVYDVLTGQRVRCDFGHRISTDEIARAVERRVAVHGQIKSRPTGEIVGMIAERVEVFPPESELPSADEVRGILRA